MDPMSVIKLYKSCKLNVNYSGVIGMGLAKIYCYVTGESHLVGEHNSLHDAHAQYIIVRDSRFRCYIDKPESLSTLDSIWADKRKKNEARHQEMNRLVPHGWSESIPKNAVFLDGDQYNKSHTGGAPHGPTSQAWTVCRKKSLADLFLSFISASANTDSPEVLHINHHQECQGSE